MTERRAPTSRVVSVGCALVSKDKAARLGGCRPWWRPTADPQGCWGQGVGGWTTQGKGVAPPLCVCRIATRKSGKSVLRPLRSASTRRLAPKVAIGALVAGLAITGAAGASADPMRPVSPTAQALDASGRQKLPGGVDPAALYAPSQHLWQEVPSTPSLDKGQGHDTPVDWREAVMWAFVAAILIGPRLYRGAARNPDFRAFVDSCSKGKARVSAWRSRQGLVRLASMGLALLVAAYVLLFLIWSTRTMLADLVG